MSQIEKLLQYQKEDSKLLRLEQEVNNSPERKSYVSARSYLKKAPEKLEQLETKAIQLKEILEKLIAKYAETTETLKDFENIDDLVEDSTEIAFYKKSVAKVSETLKNIKAQISTLSANVQAADEEYKELKKKVISIQKQFNGEISETYKNYVAEKQKEIDAIKKELQKLAEGIDPEILKRYENKRSERIFPIICALNGDRCSQCGMELSIMGKETVATKKFIECENCHRFLYRE